nr:MAG TPA: hypothetical protein [Caudoviricetes sp.]
MRHTHNSNLPSLQLRQTARYLLKFHQSLMQYLHLSAP